MSLTREQLDTIVAKALPGERLRDSRALPRGRIRLELASGERLDLHTFASAELAAGAVAALRRLRSEIDLPLPALRASDSSGELAGVACLLADPLDGDPLAQALPRIQEQQLHEIGRRLGEIVYRVHRLACERYGSLLSAAASPDERAYVLARLEQGLATGAIAGPLAEELRTWFAERFHPIGGVAALVCGGLGLDTILVRPARESWAVSGLVGWEHALGWYPAWDHAMFLDAARDPRCFALRVGYGSAYDTHNARTHEQVREAALRPYRMLLALERAAQARVSGDSAELERNRRLLDALLRFEH
jgi:hypothetical protein